MSHHWQLTTFDEWDNQSLYEALKLRQDVFVVEQSCVYLDLDDLDQVAVHMLCWEGSELRAYQRCLPPGSSFEESALGRIVVAPVARGTGLGKELVMRGIAYNTERWSGCGIRINAQSYLCDFYSGLGFRPTGEEYDEDGIMHQQMLYSLTA